MFETLWILAIGLGSANAISRSHKKANQKLAARIASQGYSPKPQVHSVITKEGLALGRKPYLGPMTAKRQKTLQSARRKRKHS